jgi:hypothetical protein
MDNMESEVQHTPPISEPLLIEGKPAQKIEDRERERVAKVKECLDIPLRPLGNAESLVQPIRLSRSGASRHVETQQNIEGSDDRRFPALVDLIGRVTGNLDFYRGKPPASHQFYTQRPDGTFVHSAVEDVLQKEYAAWFDSVFGADGDRYRQDYELLTQYFVSKNFQGEQRYSTDIRDYFVLSPLPEATGDVYPNYRSQFASALSDYFQERAGVNYVLWQRDRATKLLNVLYPDITWSRTRKPLIVGAESVVEKPIPINVTNRTGQDFYGKVVVQDENGFFDTRDVNGIPSYVIQLEIAQEVTERQVVNTWNGQTTSEVMTDEFLWARGGSSFWLGQTVPAEYSALITTAHEGAHAKVQDARDLPHTLNVFTIIHEGFATAVELETQKYLIKHAEALGISEKDKTGIQTLVDLRGQRMQGGMDAYSLGYNLIVGRFSKPDGTIDIESAYNWISTLDFESVEKTFKQTQELTTLFNKD